MSLPKQDRIDFCQFRHGNFKHIAKINIDLSACRQERQGQRLFIIQFQSRIRRFGQAAPDGIGDV